METEHLCGEELWKGRGRWVEVGLLLSGRFWGSCKMLSTTRRHSLQFRATEQHRTFPLVLSTGWGAL